MATPPRRQKAPPPPSSVAKNKPRNSEDMETITKALKLTYKRLNLKK